MFAANKSAATTNGFACLVAALVAFATQGCDRYGDEMQAQQMAARVRTEFLHAWNNYERYAWGHDALKPLSKTSHDWYGQSLQMTPVDALDTLILMKLDAEAAKTRALIVRISLSTATFTSRT